MFGVKRFQYANNNRTGDVINEDAPIAIGLVQNGTTNSIQLASCSSSDDDFYSGMWLLITDGTGANQVRRIKSYSGTTKVATIYNKMDFDIVPDTTSKYSLFDGQYIFTYYDNDNDEYFFHR